MNRFGQASCYGCQAGLYQDASGQYSCKSCPGGKYTDSTRQTACKLCDLGKHQARTRTMVGFDPQAKAALSALPRRKVVFYLLTFTDPRLFTSHHRDGNHVCLAEL